MTAIAAFLETLHRSVTVSIVNCTLHLAAHGHVNLIHTLRSHDVQQRDTCILQL